MHIGEGGYPMYKGEGGVPYVHFWAEIGNRAGVPSAEAGLSLWPAGGGCIPPSTFGCAHKLPRRRQNCSKRSFFGLTFCLRSKFERNLKKISNLS